MWKNREGRVRAGWSSKAALVKTQELSSFTLVTRMTALETSESWETFWEQEGDSADVGRAGSGSVYECFPIADAQARAGKWKLCRIFCRPPETVNSARELHLYRPGN